MFPCVSFLGFPPEGILNLTNIQFGMGTFGASRVVLVVKNLPANAGHIRNVGLVPGLGRSPGGGHGNPIWYSCLENPMDREAWWAMVQSHF